ncbi:MAG: hypothetical protein KDI13_05155 [Alphaproteobacteria bacterium]|nr:hypothetical protein [Alphaproteobacteria bacterium]
MSDNSIREKLKELFGITCSDREDGTVSVSSRCLHTRDPSDFGMYPYLNITVSDVKSVEVALKRLAAAGRLYDSSVSPVTVDQLEERLLKPEL